MEALKRNIESIKDQWAHGILTGDSAESTHMANVSALAQIRALRTLIEIEHDDLIDTLKGTEL